MRIGYFILTYNQLDWVVSKHLPSIDTTNLEFVRVHHNGLAEPDTLKVLPKQLNTVPVIPSYSQENLGVARTWNLFCKECLQQGIDVALIANDDIILYDNAIQRIVRAVTQNKNAFVAYAGPNAFSFFALPLTVFTHVGGFDEAFWPAYFEDNDYAHRMRIMQVPLMFLENQEYFHKGSATIKDYSSERLEAHHQQFRKNEAYYTRKWGGPPGRETIFELSKTS